jgi:hypothetical protein
MKSQRSNLKPEIEHKTLIDPRRNGQIILTRVRNGEASTITLWDPNSPHFPVVFDNNVALDMLWGMLEGIERNDTETSVIVPRNWDGDTISLGTT